MSQRNSEPLFDAIAPLYGLFYGWQKRKYHEILEAQAEGLDLGAYESILDVGCGTGAFSAALAELGLEVTGLEPSRKMLAVARKKTHGSGIRLERGHSTEGLPYADKAFEVSVAAFVAHGMDAVGRRELFLEMNRVSRDLVLFHDYNALRRPLTDLVEWLERGDYFRFILDGEKEMREVFQEVRVLPVGGQAAWYICTPR